jgi:hypothetical protein
MTKFDHLSSANILALNAASDRDRLVVHLLTEMSDRIHQLETRLDQSNELLAQLRDKDGDQLQSFDERVLDVLDVRSGSARAALGLEDTDVQRWMMSAIEENSHEAFGHIEAELEEKLEGFLESYSFSEAVADAVKGSMGSTVEDILEELLPDAITEALGDAEDIVRKGLRSIL